MAADPESRGFMGITYVVESVLDWDVDEDGIRTLINLSLLI